MENQPVVEENGFPARFKQFLDEFGLNTNSLANALEDSNPVKFRRWMSGEASPSTDGLIQIAIKYGVDVNWLLLGEGAMKRTARQTPTKSGTVTHVGEFVDKADWKDKVIEDQGAQIKALQKSHDQLQTALLHATYPDLFRDKEGVKMPSSSHATAIQAEIGFKQEARARRLGRVNHENIRYFDFKKARPMNPQFFR